ncbi:CocE/NonD family hydrolase [Ferruginivarius sediminum]|uniref:CocE/NonD family hydrolase n=1 Tax=Ferruginivarius sediminum TaxID=2661937 RepID=A0A369TJ03_9PROT|nr:CocE/NonD family hydrolase [Ferruginivarius sediminum]RDD62866.1 CocE/NonD family hydrolase [Ferruginivarius sediminum]
MHESGAADIEVIENTWIAMSDGCRLAAKVWLPVNAANRPIPAILEYIPYRKRDFKRIRDCEIHGFFARHGYAAVRVDLRGSGDSEGVLSDEYLPQELADGVEVIRWIATQPWCDGRVGMIGISWGGFNGLQIAALQSPELRAVITVCSSDDRYTDDVHYMGGCLLTDNLSWASVMLSYNSCPPDPEIVGARWRDMWLQRLDGSGLWLQNWLEHQRRDAFWRHGSVCEDFAAIRCPVFAVSGWADGYCNTVFRLLRNLRVPRKGLVGPWGHKYPHIGGPGPSIDFLSECVRWWDRWLKEIDNGLDDEPMLRAWMQDTVSPISDDRPGRWVAEEDWPSARIGNETYSLTPTGLHRDAGETAGADLSIRSPLSVGLFAGKWCSYSESTDLPTDQRLEDGGSLTFDSPPLPEDLEILGQPLVELELSANRPQAMVAVRLSDIGPDGTVTLVTYGLLNLSHREGHAQPQPVVPGERYRVTVRLNNVGQRFPAGNRIRVAVSTSYWPLAWPSPEPATLTIHTGGSGLVLPVRPESGLDAGMYDLGAPRTAAGPPTTLLTPAHREWTVLFNLATNEAVLQVIDNDGRWRLDDIGLAIGYDVNERYAYCNDDYTTVCGEVTNRRSFERGDWSIATTTRTILTSTSTHFRIHAAVDAYEGEDRIFSRNWDETIARDNM